MLYSNTRDSSYTIYSVVVDVAVSVVVSGVMLGGVVGIVWLSKGNSVFTSVVIGVFVPVPGNVVPLLYIKK